MSAKFPGTLYTERATENLPGIVYDPTNEKDLYSEDFQNHAAEIIAIETILGTTPQGIYATVKAWLTALASAITGKQDSLGFTPENVANKSTDGTLAANSDTNYPSQKAVKTYADTKQASLGFTPENVANKSTDGTLAANSDTNYPSQKAVKTYVDGKSGGGGGKNMIIFAGNSIIANTTAYYGITAGSATENSVQIPVSFNGTIKNLQVYIYKNNNTGNSVFTLQKAGDTALTVTVGSGVTGIIADTNHTVSVAAGDLIDVKLVTGSSGAYIYLSSITMEFDPS